MGSAALGKVEPAGEGVGSVATVHSAHRSPTLGSRRHGRASPGGYDGHAAAGMCRPPGRGGRGHTTLPVIGLLGSGHLNGVDATRRPDAGGGRRQRSTHQMPARRRSPRRTDGLPWPRCDVARMA